jgi:hypothetical protein
MKVKHNLSRLLGIFLAESRLFQAHRLNLRLMRFRMAS